MQVVQALSVLIALVAADDPGEVSNRDACCDDGCGTDGWIGWTTKVAYCPKACGYCYGGAATTTTTATASSDACCDDGCGTDGWIPWTTKDAYCRLPEACAYCYGKCLAGWPRFFSIADLAADPWGAYFKSVYGELPNSTWPLCVGDFWMFYNKKLATSGVQDGLGIPQSVGRCPEHGAPAGQRYGLNNIYSGGIELASWSWHPPPYSKGFDDDSWVEVMHESDPFGDEHFGAWFVYAKGSGVWFNLGTSRTFRTHQDAYAFFDADPHKDTNEDMCKKAAVNYDSAQFIAWQDHVNYPCDTTVGALTMNIEIVGVKLTGTYACASELGAPNSIRSGWRASMPCSCNNDMDTINCDMHASSMSADVALISSSTFELLMI